MESCVLTSQSRNATPLKASDSENTAAALNKRENIFPGQITTGVIKRALFPDQQQVPGEPAGWSRALRTLALRAGSDWLRKVCPLALDGSLLGNLAASAPASSAPAQKTAASPV